MNENLQQIDPVNINNWGKILDSAHEKMRFAGVVLSEDRQSLEKISPDSPLRSPILPEHGEPVVGAPLSLANSEITIHSTRTTSKEYAVVELRLLLPVSKIVGSEVEFELSNPVFEAQLRKREYEVGFGGILLEAYKFGLQMDSLAQSTEVKPGSQDPYRRLAKIMIERSDPGSTETRSESPKYNHLRTKFTMRTPLKDAPVTERA